MLRDQVVPMRTGRGRLRATRSGAGRDRSPVVTARQRDREARAVMAIARACGFDQPVAPLVLRTVPDVTRLLGSDDTTIRRVLGDPALRRTLRAGLVAGFETAWRQATLERIRLDHPAWLRAWWLPVTTQAELGRLLACPPPRSDDRRVGVDRAAFPATVGAAELLLDAGGRRSLDGYLLFERRVAAAVLDLAHAVAAEEGGATAGGPPTVGTGATAPPGLDARDHPYVTWWHAGD
jgi:hypothetical protein